METLETQAGPLKPRIQCSGSQTLRINDKE